MSQEPAPGRDAQLLVVRLGAGQCGAAGRRATVAGRHLLRSWEEKRFVEDGVWGKCEDGKTGAFQARVADGRVGRTKKLARRPRQKREFPPHH